MNFPVFVLAKDSGELAKFSSINEMQRELERIDIQNNEYLVWDGEGRPLDIQVHEPLWLSLQLRAASSSEINLSQALTEFGKMRGCSSNSYDSFEEWFNSIAEVKSPRSWPERIFDLLKGRTSDDKG